jgi:hypothetical protein
VADIAFGWLRDRQVPLNLIFAAFAALACVSAWLVLMLRTEVADRS